MANNGPSIGQLRALMEARAKGEAARAAAKIASANERERELEVHQAMVWAGWKGEHKFDLGPPWGVQGFTPKATEVGNVYDQYALEKWANEHGMQHLLAEPKPAKKAINQLVKRAKRGQAQLPDGVEPVDRPFVSVRDIK